MSNRNDSYGGLKNYIAVPLMICLRREAASAHDVLLKERQRRLIEHALQIIHSVSKKDEFTCK